jgi:hypothetical protein
MPIIYVEEFATDILMFGLDPVKTILDKATAQQMLDVNRQESMNCCLEKTL